MDERLGQLNWLYNQALEHCTTACQEREQSYSLSDRYKWLMQLRTANQRGLRELAVAAG